MRDGVSQAQRELEPWSGWHAEWYRAGGGKRRRDKQVSWGTVSVGLAKKLGCILWAGGPERASEKRSWSQWVSWECCVEASAMGLKEWNRQAS